MAGSFADTLAEVIGRRKVVAPDGTVIKFRYAYTSATAATAYEYVAIWVEATQKWHLTGSLHSMKAMSMGELLDVLAGGLGGTATRIMVATEWEAAS